MPVDALIIVGLAFALGGILKGASGVGSPLATIPIMVLLFDVQFAIAVFALPNLIPNFVHFLLYRRHVASLPLLLLFGLSAAAGGLVGTFLLVSISQQLLTLTIAIGLLMFVCWRLARPQWRLSLSTGEKLAAPAGFLTGILQGSAGITAPVSVTFLSLLKLERKAFIPTISFAFMSIGVVQLPALVLLGVMTTERFWLSSFALIPLLAFMPLGAYLGKMISTEQFNKLLLLFLFVIALRLGTHALFPGH